MTCGAIVLCGGRSTRMGQDKATLPFGDELLLPRVVRLLGEVVPTAHIVCVAAADQKLPPLSAGVRVARDRAQGRGPLEGLAVGLAALGDEVEAAYATSCDAPLLSAAFVERMFEQLGDYEIAAPQEDAYHHPLAAVYRPGVLREIESLLSADRLRPIYLFDACRTRHVPVADLREVDPQLHSLLNCNTPEDYQHALTVARDAPPPSRS